MASELRRFIRGVGANGALWALGSGLASGTVVNYLAMDYGAAGLALSLAIAAPKLTSLVQLVQPWFSGRLVPRKTLCIGAFLVSALTLTTLPGMAEAAAAYGDSRGLAALIAGWALYHLLEYVGAAALWSWMRDEVPGRVRGRAWGVRESWMAYGRWVGLFAGVGLAEAARSDWLSSNEFWWLSGAAADGVFLQRHLLLALGGTILVTSIVPLVGLRDRRDAPERFPFEQYAQAFRSPAFLKLLAFSTLLALANGFAQAPQGLFPYKVLGLSLTTMLVLRAILFAGQSLVSGWFGRRFDAGGHRRWMLTCQFVVAAGGALFLVATPGFPWPFHAAWVLWIAYAGLNVAIPDLTLRFAPRGSAGPWIALSFSAGAVSFGVATVLGGWAFESVPLESWLGFADSTRGRYDAFFVVASVLRLLAAGCLFLLPASLPFEDSAGASSKP